MCVYVGEISPREGQRLGRTIRRGRDRIEVRRAQVVLASAQGAKVPDIARRLYFSPQYVRAILKRFNEEGFASLAPRSLQRAPAPVLRGAAPPHRGDGLVSAGPAGPPLHPLVSGQAA